MHLLIVLVFISSGKWVCLGQQKKNQKNFYSEKILKFIKKFQSFFTFQEVIHEVNLMTLGSIKI